MCGKPAGQSFLAYRLLDFALCEDKIIQLDNETIRGFLKNKKKNSLKAQNYYKLLWCPDWWDRLSVGGARTKQEIKDLRWTEVSLLRCVAANVYLIPKKYQASIAHSNNLSSVIIIFFYFPHKSNQRDSEHKKGSGIFQSGYLKLDLEDRNYSNISLTPVPVLVSFGSSCPPLVIFIRKSKLTLHGAQDCNIH